MSTLTERVQAMTPNQLNAADARTVAQALRRAVRVIAQQRGNLGFPGDFLPYVQLADDMVRRWEELDNLAAAKQPSQGVYPRLQARCKLGHPACPGGGGCQ